jgi:hypothetical protein
MAALFVVANLGLQLKPSPILLGALVPAIAIALLNRPRPLGLDGRGLHIGSPDEGFVMPWSNITGVVALPRNLLALQRVRIRIADGNLAPGRWARIRWGVRSAPGSELEVPLGYGQSSVEIADEIRRFIDAYS